MLIAEATAWVCIVCSEPECCHVDLREGGSAVRCCVSCIENCLRQLAPDRVAPSCDWGRSIRRLVEVVCAAEVIGPWSS